jgi:hypothetical protein
MSLRRALYVLLCLGAAILAGCNSGGGVGAKPINTRVRLVNLIPDASSITLTIDTDAPLVAGVAFEQQTQYLDVTSGTHVFTVSDDSGNQTIIDVTQSLVNGQDYTLVVFGLVESASSQFELDSTLSIPQSGTFVTVPNSGTFGVRLGNFAEGVGSLDLYLTAAGADISVTAPLLVNVTLGSTSVFATLPMGSYELRLTPTGTKEVVYDTGVIAFGDQAIVQAIAYSKGSSKLVGIDVLNIDSQGTGQIAPNLLAQFKLVNASSVGPPLNVLVDGALTLANVPFAGVSNYVKTGAGSRVFSIESSATPGASLLTFPANLGPATDTSIVVSGPAGALRALVLTDNNMPSATGRARVRFVNASPDLAALDVFINFALTFTGVLSNSASPYTELVANVTGSKFNFAFNIAGTTTPALILPSVTLAAGKTYTVYVVGPGASPQGVVVSDN